MSSNRHHRQWVLAALDSLETRLLGYVARLLHGDDEAARDVVQHAFLRLCDQREVDIGPHVAPWLFTVCRNRAMDLIRERCRQDAFARVQKLNGHVVAGNGVDPAASAEQSDLAAELRGLLAHLPAAQREAIDLWAQGLSYREIAEVLARGEVGVRVLVHRGLRSVRQHPRVKKWLEEETDVTNQSGNGELRGVSPWPKVAGRVRPVTAAKRRRKA